jgi:signal transduction histidine kinase
VDLSVTDTGPGISPAEQPTLFERRYRGTGLGLNIATQIIERHGGQLEEGIPGRG